MAIKPNPTLHKQSLVTARGVLNADAIAAACVRVGIQFYAAVALIQGESRGRNVYGHDQGGVNSGYKELDVTLLNWHKFYADVVVNNKRSNGVGPAQITYRGYFDLMLGRGLQPWVPVDNIQFGLELLLGNYQRTKSWAEAGTLYNVGNLNNGVNDYGTAFAARVADWKAYL